MDHYLKPILEHKNLVVAVTAVTALLAMAASMVLPPSYRSTASVLLTPISGNPLTPFESDTEVDMPTELLISTSKAVVGRVADDLTAQSIDVDGDVLADNISAASPRDSKVLDLTYRATTPELAQTVADSFAENYLEYREQIAAENRTEAVELLNERIALLKGQLSEIEGRLSQLESGTQPYVSLSVERNSVEGELLAQQAGLASLSTLSLNAGEVLSPARLPTAPSNPGLISLLAGGLAGGLVIGVVAAMLLSAVRAGRAPRNRRASDHIENNRRQEDRFQFGGRRATDRPAESAVEKLARVTAERRQDIDGDAQQEQAREIADDETAIDENPTDESGVDDSAVEDGGVEDSEVEVSAVDENPTEAMPDVEPPPRAEPSGPEKGVVHTGAPPPPPSTRRRDRRPPGDAAPAPDSEHDAAPDPKTPIPAIDHAAAAYFGDNVPPPPRNKAKLGSEPDQPTADVAVERRSTGATLGPQAPIIPSNLEVESDFARLVDEIGRQLTDGPLACLAVGQNNRAQSLAAGFALVDGLKDLDVDVLIVDAVLGEPLLSKVLDLPDGPGLSELIVGQAPMKTTVRQLEGFRGLYAVTTGKPTPLARSAFGTASVGDLLRRAKGRFPMTVIIGGDLADAAILSGTDGELDGLVVAASAPPGQPADPALIQALSVLNAPTWIRISVSADSESTSTAATATTIA